MLFEAAVLVVICFCSRQQHRKWIQWWIFPVLWGGHPGSGTCSTLCRYWWGNQNARSSSLTTFPYPVDQVSVWGAWRWRKEVILCADTLHLAQSHGKEKVGYLLIFCMAKSKAWVSWFGVILRNYSHLWEVIQWEIHTYFINKKSKGYHVLCCQYQVWIFRLSFSKSNKKNLEKYPPSSTKSGSVLWPLLQEHLC